MAVDLEEQANAKDVYSGSLSTELLEEKIGLSLRTASCTAICFIGGALFAQATPCLTPFESLTCHLVVFVR